MDLRPVVALEPPEHPERLRLGAALDPPVAEQVDQERGLPVETVDGDAEVDVIEPGHEPKRRRRAGVALWGHRLARRRSMMDGAWSGA